MDAQTTTLLASAGVIGGIVNAIAGGATLITFPAMLAAGLPPLIANASNAVAVIPGHLTAALADRHQLPTLDRGLVVMISTAIIGGASGAVLLLVTPERLFATLVPALIGLATLIFALGRHLKSVLSQHSHTQGNFLRSALLLPVAVYGGYFGAGLGVMLLALLTLTSTQDIRAINALKNLLATAVSFATLAIFIAQNVIRWPETLVMLVGAVCGGMLGGELIAILPQPVVRVAITAIGTAMTVIYAWRYWY
jgi:uncharacterized protein